MDGATGVVVSFRAGKCQWTGTMVKPDKRKGKLSLIMSEDDGLTHVQWQDRTSGNVEDDLIVIQDAYLEKIDKVKDGRVYLLRFTSSSKKIFIWMQEPDSSKDEELVKKFNDHIDCVRPATGQVTPASQVPPTTPAGGASEAGASATSAAAGTAPGAAGTGSGPAVTSNATAAAAPAAALGVPGNQQNLDQALASILQQFSAAPSQQPQVPVMLGDMIEKEDLLSLMEDPEAVAELKDRLADGADKTDEELRDTLQSPQVTGSMRQLSQVIYSDQVAALFSSMGLDTKHLNGIGVHPMHAVVQEIGRAHV